MPGNAMRSDETREQITYPWDETLIEAKNATATPNCAYGLKHRFRAVGGHLGLEDFQRLPKRRNLRMSSMHGRQHHNGFDMPPARNIWSGYSMKAGWEFTHELQ